MVIDTMTHWMTHWTPTTSIQTLHQRAAFIKKTRLFFEQLNFLEVETPILSAHTVTDPFLTSFSTTCFGNTYYLQTSPEYHMKRLLAAGSGPIFQITHSFRQDEKGSRHNPEFTMLEWYYPSYNHHQLMDQMADFLSFMLSDLPIENSRAQRMSYDAIFQHYLQINPHLASIEILQTCAQNNHIEIAHLVDGNNDMDKDAWLDLLMSHCIEPKLGLDSPLFIYDYPASQAALSAARRDPEKSYSVGERFEVYYQGIELANGFHELTDATEQKKRFEENLEKRQRLNLPALSLDHYFLKALEDGLPACSGVALGLDRLLMLALNKKKIADVMSFTIDNA